MGKYEPLWNCIKEQNQDSLRMSFDEIRDVLGFEIDHSFLTFKKELKEYGYEVGKISLKEKNVTFKRIA